MKSSTKLFTILVQLLIGSTCHGKMDYPRNGRFFEQGYRSMTIVWDQVPNFNATGDSDGEFYEIRFELNNPPSYFPQTMIIEMAYQEPAIQLSNLLINTQVRMRVGLKYNTRKPVKLFSPYEVFKTQSVPAELELELPAGVSDIQLEVVDTDPLRQVSHIHLAWTAPKNIITASNKLVKSIQYSVVQCEYNPLIDRARSCSLVSEIPQDHNVKRQTTRLRMFYQHNKIIVKRNRDVAFFISSVAINGQEGGSTRMVTRLDPSSEPAKPYNLTQQISINKNIFVLTWISDSPVTSYRVAYNIYNERKKDFIIVTEPSVKISDLQSSTKYEFRIAVEESVNGTSGYSDSLIVYSPKGTISSSNRSIPEKTLLLAAVVSFLTVL